jgi:tRNA G37 N-methylase TrmD
MTVKAWCLENKVDQKQFFYWQRKIREEICASVETPPKEQPTVFVPLQIQDYDKKALQTVTFRPDLVISIGDYRLELGNQTSPELLDAVLKVIRHV